MNIVNSLREVSEQDSLSRAAGSPKKWRMMLSAQKDIQARRRVWVRELAQEKSQDPANRPRHRCSLMMMV